MIKKAKYHKTEKKQQYNSDVTQQLTTDKFCAKRFLIIPTKIAKLNIKTSISKTAGIEIPYNKYVGPQFTRPSHFAAAAIDRYPLWTRARAQQQTRRPPPPLLLLLLLIDETDRRTDIQPFYNAYRILCGQRNKRTYLCFSRTLNWKCNVFYLPEYLDTNKQPLTTTYGDIVV